MIKEIVEGYDRARNYDLSSTKVVFWSKRTIMHGSLDSLGSIGHQIELTTSNFKIKTNNPTSDKKASKYLKRQKTEKNSEQDEFKFSTQDYIESIFCRNSMYQNRLYNV